MGLIKVSDYVSRFLVAHGIQDIFLVSGGGIMHLLDSVGRQEGLRYWCNYHEQACAIAAEGYAKHHRGVGACLVTVGPGGVNALSGVAGAWMDSTPVFVISGQVRRDIIADYRRIRQMGPQEADVVGMAGPVTKYAVTVMDPARIRYELEKAWHLATSGRPGPVWVDLPLDVQGAMVEEADLPGFEPPPESWGAELPGLAGEVLARLGRARRPLVLAGNGIHRSRAEARLLAFLERSGIPMVLPYSAKDLIPEDHPLNMGVFGTAGQRRANFALQNSDCLLSLASGLCISKTGFNVSGFAPAAAKILVDIDEGQLHHQVIKPDLAIQADAGAFLNALLEKLDPTSLSPDPRWSAVCAHWKEAYPLLTPDCFADPDHVNTYVFMDRLAEAMGEGDVLVTGNGMDIVSHYQAFRIKAGQRTIVTGNWGAMGWDLPLAVGACIARGRQRTVLVTGDGSFLWNVQELMTLQQGGLPIKVFVFNNRGYSSIRATQNAFFGGFHVGADARSGVANPDFAALASAFRMGYGLISTHEGLDQGIAVALSGPGAFLCEVNIAPDQAISPKASAFRREDGSFESRPLEDMAPFLPREEIWQNMHLFDDAKP